MIVLATFGEGLKRALPAGPRARRMLAGCAFLAGSALLSVSIFATAPSAQPESRQEKAWPVSAIEAKPTHLTPMFTGFGRVESSRVSRIQSDQIQVIEAVHVREGDIVERAEVLIELNRAELELTVAEREADLAEQQAVLNSVRTEEAFLQSTSAHHATLYALAQKKLKRHQDLFEKRMISQALLDDVTQQSNATSISYQQHKRALSNIPSRLREQQARIARAEAALEQARLDLERTRIAAPFRGPVLAVYASPGNHSVLGATLIEIADEEGIEIRAPLPNEYVPRVRAHLAANRAITATTRAGGKPLGLRLTRLAGNVARGHSGVDAFFKPVDPTELPELGRVLDLTVTLPAESNVVAVPVQSIYENDRIYEITESNRLDSITVERVGDYRTESGEHRVLIRSPSLSAGKRIITTQLPRAISGLLVAPVG